MIRGLNAGGDEIFRPRPEGPWGPLACYAMGTGSFSEAKGLHYPLPSSVEVRERVQLYLYSPLWHDIECN